MVTQNDSTKDIMARAMGRSKERFFDDVILKEIGGRFVGLIRMGTLIEPRSRFSMENIETLEKQQVEPDQKNRQMEGELILPRHSIFELQKRSSAVLS